MAKHKAATKAAIIVAGALQWIIPSFDALAIVKVVQSQYLGSLAE
jgi:hypothetical protein